MTARWSPRLMIAAFSRAIASTVAQVLHVVERDVGDCAHPALPDVRRVQSSAHAHLDHRHIDAPRVGTR